MKLYDTALTSDFLQLISRTEYKQQLRAVGVFFFFFLPRSAAAATFIDSCSVFAGSPSCPPQAKNLCMRIRRAICFSDRQSCASRALVWCSSFAVWLAFPSCLPASTYGFSVQSTSLVDNTRICMSCPPQCQNILGSCKERAQPKYAPPCLHPRSQPEAPDSGKTRCIRYTHQHFLKKKRKKRSMGIELNFMGRIRS